MADRKITDLTALAAGSQATGDLLTIVDVSEAAATDKNKKITVESLFKGIPSSVGVGVASPTFPSGTGIEINDSSTPRLKLSNSTTGTGSTDGSYLYVSGSDFLIENKESANMRFYTSASERLRIDSSGFLGLGTSSPAHELHISGSGDTRALITSGGSGDAVMMFENASGNTWGHGLDLSSGNYVIGYNASGDPSLTTQGKLNIDTSGNVGVGTSTIGSASLTLYGSGSRTMYQGSSTGTGNGNGFTTGNNGAADAFLWNYENGFVQVATNNTERLRIDSSGNAGLGRSSASCRLHIATSVANASSPVGMQIGNDGSGSGTGASISLGAGNAAASTAGNIAGFFDGTGTALSFSTSSNYGVSTYAERMRIDSSGNLKFNSGFGSVGTAYGCRAWVNFNGTGTVAIRDSGNVSSITDNGTGNYTIAFTTAMPDANYCVVTTSSYATGVTESMFTTVNGDALFTTGGFNAKSRDDGGTLRDVNYFFAAVFR